MACGYCLLIGKLSAIYVLCERIDNRGSIRFGFGKTTMVPVEKRVETWAKIVPKLLGALGIKHVALMSHSAGTIYLLNVLWHCRQILHPKHPHVILFGQ